MIKHLDGLPMFGFAGSSTRLDVPVPDFTFYSYPQAIASAHLAGNATTTRRSATTSAAAMRRRERAASSWEATHALLSEAATATPFAQREERLLWRGSVRGSRCRARVVPILHTKLDPQLSDANVSLRVDLADSGWFGANRTAFTSLSDQCASKYLLHLRGNGYSAGLKYKLACGSLVVRMRPEPYDEFYYSALREGEHFLAVDLPSAPYISKADRELGVTAVERVTVAQLRSLFERLLQRGEEGQALAERIANAGREFAREQLSASALHCYWRLVLEHYASLYFT